MKARITSHLMIVVLLVLVSCSPGEEPPVDLLEETPLPPISLISYSIVEDEVENTPLVLVGNQELNLAVAYQRSLNGQVLSFTAIEGGIPAIMEDNLGNQYNVFGEVISGPDEGNRLEFINSGPGYWFAFSALYPGLELQGQGTITVDLQLDTLPGWSVASAALATGAGFDAIPALKNPDFLDFHNLLPPGSSESFGNNDFFIRANDLVIAVSLNGETKVYPHAILDWHEIINDKVGGVPITVTYCPLTGTAKVWERADDLSDLDFGVSGLLYNNNVLPFDRGTESFWLQLEARAVFGPRSGETRPLVPFVETTLRTIFTLSGGNELQVMSEETGEDRNYRQFPYGDYRTDNFLGYPILFDDNRLPRKERVFSVIIDGNAKVYPFNTF